MQQKCDEKWIKEFDISRTIGGLALLKVNFIGNELANNIIDNAIKFLKENEPKKGAWIRHGEPPIYVVECSNCGLKYSHHALSNFQNYCPNCGAKMESWICENQAEAKSNIKDRIKEWIHESDNDI